MRYGELAAALEPHGLALHNLASLPHISVAGAIATATHGSGDGNRNLAAAVAGLELVTASGELITVRRGDADFEGHVVGLGALGAVIRVELDAQPAYEVRQRVYEPLPWDALREALDAVMAAAYSVSVFHRCDAGQVWVKARLGDTLPDELFGATPADGPRHMIAGLDPVNTTDQTGEPGPWADRLPHFRMGFTPSNGDELQSEYHVPRAQAGAALDVLRDLADRIRPVLQIGELRTVAADDLWLSPQHGRDTLGVHFTWRPDTPAVTAVLETLEPRLLELGARPHWGKVFLTRDAGAGYERLGDFLALAERLDPRGAFRNPWFEHHVLGH
jgi:alditol oxidase